jgi:hypothetical protein
MQDPRCLNRIRNTGCKNKPAFVNLLPVCRLLARDAGGETEGVLLNETVPSWVVDIVVEKKLPKFIKVSLKIQYRYVNLVLV